MGTDSGAALALLLAVSCTPRGLLQTLSGALGTRATLAYLAVALLLAVLTAWLLTPLLTSLNVL